jgi:uncharacterized protein (TIGR00269 family)
MECDKCDAEAVMTAAYSGLHLCDTHFCRSVESRVRRRVREDSLLPDDAAPDDPETWLIGLSGGKDSVVLTEILHDTFEQDPRVEIIALTIHEGIEGYRDESLEACLDLTDDLDMRHEVVTYEEEFDLRMDEVVEDDPENMAACGYCGAFRRDILARYADELGADKLLTGHNLDDEEQTALMNFLEGNVEKMARQYDASLGPFEGNGDGNPRTERDDFIPRAKPLRDIPEREVALYAHLANLPAHITECPHADEAYRGEIQNLLFDLEERHPGTRHSIMAGYEELAALAADDSRDRDEHDVGRCDRCGEKFNSEYNLQLHQQMDICSAEKESSSQEQSTEPEAGDKRKHVSGGVTGTVCMFNDDRGFGFVTTADLTTQSGDAESTVDVFLHISDVSTACIEKGDRLQFDVYETDEGFEAEAAEVLKRGRNRDRYDELEDDRSPRLGFGHNKDDRMLGHGKPAPSERDIESFQDERKFR